MLMNFFKFLKTVNYKQIKLIKLIGLILKILIEKNSLFSHNSVTCNFSLVYREVSVIKDLFNSETLCE